MQDATVYTILIAIGFLLSIVLSLVLLFSENTFIILIALYLIGISIYTFVYFSKNEKKNDINFKINKYLNIFNIGISTFLLILMIVKFSFGGREGLISRNNVSSSTYFRR